MRAKWSLAVGGMSLFFLVAGVAQAAGNPVAGREKAYTCLGCHGVKGYRTMYPSYHVPLLGGQHAQYIVNALMEYKNGQRKMATMQAQAESLSKQDMEDIAAYFSQKKQ